MNKTKEFTKVKMESRFRGMQSVEGQKPSLKQILKEHYNNRDFTVKKDVANTYGVCYFLYTIFTQCYGNGLYGIYLVLFIRLSVLEQT